MRKTTASADRLSDLEITTCILRRSPARSCSSVRTWWSSAVAIAAGVLLVLGLSAAAGCEDDKPYEATCEEQIQKEIDCGFIEVDDFDLWVDGCEEDRGLDLFDCQRGCNVDQSCGDYECCFQKCAGCEVEDTCTEC